MSSKADERTPYEIIEQEKEAYLEELPEPDPDWPPDVQVVYEDIHSHLFEMDLQVQGVFQRCGYHNNNISTRFGYFVGRTPKEYILYHRVSVAQSLLRDKDLSVSELALTIGFGSPSAFTRAFKERVGQVPSRYSVKK